jgi:DNA-binding response OmpR family regulator
MCTDKPRVLLVDDKPDIRETFTLILEAEGYAVETARTGAECLSLVDTNCIQSGACYDLIILDVDLPDNRGTSLAFTIRNTHPYVSLMLLTAFGLMATTIRTSDALDVPLLTKPITDFPAFLRLVEELVARTRAKRPQHIKREAVEVPEAITERMDTVARERAKA